jgi:hypothetical protein
MLALEVLDGLLRRLCGIHLKLVPFEDACQEGTR